MTAERQERYGSRRGIALFALLAGFLAALSLDFAARAATTERVVVNRYSGLAIEGFDPGRGFDSTLWRPLQCRGGHVVLGTRKRPFPTLSLVLRLVLPKGSLERATVMRWGMVRAAKG